MGSMPSCIKEARSTPSVEQWGKCPMILTVTRGSGHCKLNSSAHTITLTQ
jgi:hypothetical protein